jgi:prevent-host-death family protein
MKQVTLQALKRHLSKLVREAASGERIVITRYRRPVAELSAADRGGLHVGSKVGKGSLEPLFHDATRGRYLQILEEDRYGHEGP